jgi:hypothetical protein
MGCASSRAGGAVGLVAPLLTAPGGAAAIDPRTALDALCCPSDTRARVEDGQVVEAALPTHSDRGLDVGIAFLVAKQSPAAFARSVREEKRVLRADPNLFAFGDFEGGGTVADLARQRLTPAQRKSFAHAAPGEDGNLSRDEIAALYAAPRDVQAIEDPFRAMLLSRDRASRARGLAGIAPYAREGRATSASDDLSAFNRGARASQVLAPQVYDLLDRDPGDVPPDVATPSRRSSFLPVDHGTLVIYVNHRSTEQVAGFGVGTERAIGRSLLAGRLKRVFETPRAGHGR